MTIKEIGIKLGIIRDEKSFSEAKNAVSGLKNIAVKALGAIGIGISLTQLNAIAEEFNGINDKINYAVRGLSDQKKAQDEILKAANDCKTSYDGMAGSVTQLVNLNSGLFPVDEAVEFVSLTQKLLMTAGKSESEASSVQRIISRVFQTGEVTSGVLRNLYSQAPEVLNAVSGYLGVTTGSLYDLADAGELTGQTIKDAVMGAAGSINADFAGLNYSISDALLHVRNRWGYFVDELNTTLGLTETIAKGITKLTDKAMTAAQKLRDRIVWLSEKLGGTRNLLKLIGIAAGAVFLAMNAGKILGFLKGITSLLGGINLKTLGIAAVILGLALIVEDFVNFMQGNDSVIGEVFKKAGIDADSARATIIKAWNKVKSILSNVWNAIKSVGETVFGGLKSFWDEHGESIKNKFVSVWEAVSAFLTSAWGLIRSIAVSVFGGLKSFWETWGDDIVGIFRGAWEILGDIAGLALDLILDLLGTFTALFSGDWEGFWDGITGFFSDAWDGIKDIASKAFDWLKSLGTLAWDWGSDVIGGLIDGIKSGIGRLGDAAKEAASKIKSFLGFSEPEEGPLSDFHTYMPDMIQLMSDGIRSGRGKLRDALEDLTGDMSVMARANIVGRDTAERTVGKAGNTIVQNVSFTNTFNGGETAVQRNVARTMTKSAEDTTSLLARGLAYAR